MRTIQSLEQIFDNCHPKKLCFFDGHKNKHPIIYGAGGGIIPSRILF